LTGDAEVQGRHGNAQKRVVRVLEQSATVIKAEVSSTSSDSMAAGFLGVELDYQLTRSPAHAYGQSEASLAIMELQLSSNTIGMERSALVPQFTTFRLTNRYTVENLPAISTTYGVLKSNPILPPEAINKLDLPRRRVTYHNRQRTCSACGGGPFRENQGTKHKRGDSSTI
jgi:hypothetical protein